MIDLKILPETKEYKGVIEKNIGSGEFFLCGKIIGWTVRTDTETEETHVWPLTDDNNNQVDGFINPDGRLFVYEYDYYLEKDEYKILGFMQKNWSRDG